MPTQFCKCTFRDGDVRSYTYANDGEPVAPGDLVSVADSRDPDSWKRVRVVEVSDEAPPFACKPVLGRVEDDTTDDDSTFLKEMTK